MMPIFCARMSPTASVRGLGGERPTKVGRLGDEADEVTRPTRRERELESLLALTVKALGCEVWGLEYRPRGRGRTTLRLYIDKADGVAIDDCERVSQQVGALLDVEDAIVDSYRLEVSSPGLDRVLFRREQYLACVGEHVDVRLAVPFEGRRHFQGQLAGLEGEDVVVRVEEDEEPAEYLLPLEQIQRTRIVPDFARSPDAARPRAAKAS